MATIFYIYIFAVHMYTSLFSLNLSLKYYKSSFSAYIKSKNLYQEFGSTCMSASPSLTFHTKRKNTVTPWSHLSFFLSFKETFEKVTSYLLFVFATHFFFVHKVERKGIKIERYHAVDN